MLTIGHSTLPIEIFLAILRENGVASLVDIRTIPRSRHNPQFERQALEASLQQAGIAYRWMQSLGGLRHPRRDSSNTGWRNASFRGYADYMQTPEFAAALDDLIREQAERSTVIMCAESVPWRCHRSLVADALTLRGVPVEHITYTVKGKSQRQPHTMTPFARVEGGRLWYPAEDELFASMDAPQPNP